MDRMGWVGLGIGGRLACLTHNFWSSILASAAAAALSGCWHPVPVAITESILETLDDLDYNALWCVGSIACIGSRYHAPGIPHALPLCEGQAGCRYSMYLELAMNACLHKLLPVRFDKALSCSYFCTTVRAFIRKYPSSLPASCFCAQRVQHHRAGCRATGLVLRVHQAGYGHGLE